MVLRLILGNGVKNLLLHRLLEGFLHGNLRIHLSGLIFGQIFLVQPGQLLRHVHVSIEIDKAVGRVVVGPVEVQKLLVSQLRDYVRISS